MAPTPATAAGTAEPTARNLEATATPHDSPSAERATIEKVMRRTLARDSRLPGPGEERGEPQTRCPRPHSRLHHGPVPPLLTGRLGFPRVGEHRRFVTAI